jgi:hypothetical protein
MIGCNVLSCSVRYRTHKHTASVEQWLLEPFTVMKIFTESNQYGLYHTEHSNTFHMSVTVIPTFSMLLLNEEKDLQTTEY